MIDLLKLTHRPVDAAKVFRMALRQKSCLASACIIRRVSSAYCTMGKSEVGCGMGSFSIPWSFKPLIIYCKISAAKTNNRGESGSPCLTPLLKGKLFPGTPFRRTAALPEERMAVTQLSHCEGNSSFNIISSITLCSIVSNAFVKSSLTITISFLDCWH